MTPVVSGAPGTRTPCFKTSEVAALCRVDSRTIRNWITVGVQTPRGRVKLWGRKIGRDYRTTEEALAEFEAACNPVAEGGGSRQRSAPPPDPLDQLDPEDRAWLEEMRKPGPKSRRKGV